MAANRFAVETSCRLAGLGCSSWVMGGSYFRAMPLWSKIVGAVAIFVASFLAADWIIDRTGLIPPGCPSGETVTFRRPFVKNGTVGYVFDAPELVGYANAAGAGTRSPYIICENSTILGPANQDLGDIGRLGVGRYNHWGPAFFFSTSDNTNPNTNSRTYLAVRVR